MSRLLGSGATSTGRSTSMARRSPCTYHSVGRNIAAARTFLTSALTVHGDPGEVITDRAPALANVVEGLLPAALHNTGQYKNNRVEGDHGRLKARVRPMRGVKTNRTASVLIRGH